jgi:hypothetical protein
MRNTHIIEKIAYFKIFLGNGVNYLSDLKYPFVIAIGLKVYFPNASIALLGIISIISIFLLVLLGWFDLKYIHLLQTTTDINTRVYNPYFAGLENRLIKRFK